MLLLSFAMTLVLNLLIAEVNVMMTLPICSLMRKGAASYVLKESSKAIVTDCCSHNLKLSLASSRKHPEINNILKTYKSVTIFFGSSPKREGLLGYIVKSCCIGTEKRKVLVGMCKILWSERYISYEHFYLAKLSRLKPLT